MSEKTLGQIAYETGQESTLRLMPGLKGDWLPWDQIGPLQQVHEEAAAAVRAAVIEECALLIQRKREDMRFSDQRDMCDEIVAELRARVSA